MKYPSKNACKIYFRHSSISKIEENFILVDCIRCFFFQIVSFLLEMPNFFGWGDHVYDPKTLTCIWDRTADYSYTIFFDVMGVAIPVSLIFVCYLRIWLFVRASKRKIKSHVEKGSRDARDSMKLARTLFIIFVVFVGCWSPYALIILLDKNDTYAAELHTYSVLIAHINSSLNR